MAWVYHQAPVRGQPGGLIPRFDITRLFGSFQHNWTSHKRKGLETLGRCCNQGGPQREERSLSTKDYEAGSHSLPQERDDTKRPYGVRCHGWHEDSERWVRVSAVCSDLVADGAVLTVYAGATLEEGMASSFQRRISNDVCLRRHGKDLRIRLPGFDF